MAHIVKPPNYSQTRTCLEGAWHEGNAPIMGPRSLENARRRSRVRFTIPQDEITPANFQSVTTLQRTVAKELRAAQAA